MQKLTQEESLEAYKLSWRGDMSNAEIAEKYHVTKAHISAIKNGYIWSSVTLHQKGKVPSVARMPFDEKMKTILKKPDADITIDNRFWDLYEEHGQDTADQFKHRIHEKRLLLNRKLMIPEIEEIYEKLRKND
jgi:uncharacterized protein YjcR